MASNSPSGKPMNQDNAAIATLGIRVTSMEGQVSELRSAMSAGQSALSTEIRNVTTTLTSKIDERSRQPWQLYVSVLIGIFSLYAYIDNSKIGPLKEKDEDIRAAVKGLSDVIRTDVVPQWVHQREWLQRDDKFKAYEDRLKVGETALQDRIRRMEDMFGNTWNLRDAINGVQSRIDKLEEMRRHSEKAEQPRP